MRNERHRDDENGADRRECIGECSEQPAWRCDGRGRTDTQQDRRESQPLDGSEEQAFPRHDTAESQAAEHAGKCDLRQPERNVQANWCTEQGLEDHPEHNDDGGNFRER